MSRLFKELSVIEFNVSSNKNIYVVNVRNIDKTQVQKKFDSFDDAMKYYKSLDSVKIVAPKKEVAEEIKEIDKKDFGVVVKDAINAIEIIAYAKENPNKRSARHLNKKFSLKLKQKEYDEILKGL